MTKRIHSVLGAQQVRVAKRGLRSTALLVMVASWVLLATVVAGQSFPTNDQCSLIAGARLISMDGPEASAPSVPQDVLVCGQTIKAIGVNGSLDVPEGTAKIDAGGKVLLPGLFDAHVHLFAPLDFDLNLAWGVTGVRNLFGNVMNIGMRDRLNKGETWGPRFFTAGPIIDGKPPIWPTSTAATNAEEAKQAVAEQLEAGYDFIKLYSRLGREPFFAAIEAASTAERLVGGHVPYRVSLKDAAFGGMDFIEHLTGFVPAAQGEESPWLALSGEQRSEASRSERGRLQLEGFDPATLPEIAKWMVENSVWNVPTFLVVERISASLPQKEKWLGSHPQMRTLSPMSANMWNPANDFRLQNKSEEDLAIEQRTAGLHYPIVKALHDAGAELMLGTDTPNPFVFTGFSIHEELQRFVKAGLTPWQALRCATVQPARFLGQEDVFGRIKVGLEADLLLLDQDPLADITNTQNIAAVMTRGRWLDRKFLDERLDRVAKAYGKE